MDISITRRNGFFKNAFGSRLPLSVYFNGQLITRLAKGETGSAETVAWAAACAKSGLCVSACPERSSGLDAMLLVRIAKQHALNEIHQLAAKYDPTYFPRIKTFARLQLTDEELAKWL